MTTDKLETGGPAFPVKVSINRDTEEFIPHQFGNDDFIVPGMTLRTYAAIHLGVPQSEHEFINDMIRESQRFELAKAAMQAAIPMVKKESDVRDLILVSYQTADAMLAEQEKENG